MDGDDGFSSEPLLGDGPSHHSTHRFTPGLLSQNPCDLVSALAGDTTGACEAAMLPARFTRFYVSKWVTFSCASVVMLSAGLPYAFSIYGPSLRDALSLDSDTVSRMGVFSNAGGYTALMAGLFYDYVKRWKRAGPILCIAVGALLFVCGYGGLDAVARGHLPAHPAVLYALCFVASNAGTWLEAAALTTCVRNFETERAAVVGIMKSFLGLSASVYTTLYVTFCASRLDVLRLLATVPACTALLLARGINQVPFRQTERHSKAHAFHIAVNSTISLAIYQLVSAMWFQAHPREQSDAGWMMCVALVCLSAPILQLPAVFGGVRAVPLAEELATLPALRRQLSMVGESAAVRGAASRAVAADALTLPGAMPSGSADVDGAAAEPLPPQAHPRAVSKSASGTATPDLRRPSGGGGAGGSRRRGAGGGSDDITGATDRVNLTLLECLRDPDYWLLTASISVLTGVGLAFINNASSYVACLGGDESLTSAIVSLFSVANCLGRMSVGFLPERPFGDAGPVLRRPAWYVISALPSVVCSFALARGSLTGISAVTLIYGFFFGLQQSVAPTMVSELFGLAHFATNTAALQSMFTASSFAFASALPSWALRRASSGGAVCRGAACYALTFNVSAAAAAAAALLAVLLASRKARFYARITRRVERERGKRGTAAVQRERERTLLALDRRLNAASTAVMHAQFAAGRAASAAEALAAALGRRPPAQAADAAHAVSGAVGELDAVLCRAAGVLEGDDDDELLSESVADSESFIDTSPVRWRRQAWAHGGEGAV